MSSSSPAVKQMRLGRPEEPLVSSTVKTRSISPPPTHTILAPWVRMSSGQVKGRAANSSQEDTRSAGRRAR